MTPGGVHKDVYQLPLPGWRQAANRPAKQLMPKMGRALINDEGRDREIQRRPDFNDSNGGMSNLLQPLVGAQVPFRSASRACDWDNSRARQS
jgi:hypothetical protein